MDDKKRKPKIRSLTAKTCAVCIDDITEGVLLHKTQRQTHILCINCAEAYLLSELESNILNKRYDHKIYCSGLFDGTKRNKCQHILDVSELKIPNTMDKVNILIAKITALTMPGATQCYNGICNNIVLIPDNTQEANCTDCKVTWCHKCNSTPYHEGVSCQQHKFINDSSPETLEIKKMVSDGKVRLCPTCNYGIEKNTGCNKMTCSQCGNTLCWLCGKGPIDYDHFKSGSCNQRLFI